jgi:hypothetical protein
MTRDEQLLAYYSKRVELANRILAEAPSELRQRIDFDNGYWHERTILQRLLEKAGMPVCHGALDCVGPPTTTCITTNHPACRQHVYSCYLCVSIDAE